MRSAAAALFAAVVRVAWTRCTAAAYQDYAYTDADFFPELRNPSGPDADADDLHERRCTDCGAAPRRPATSRGEADRPVPREPPHDAVVGLQAPQQAAVVTKRRDHRHRVVVPPNAARPRTSEPAALGYNVTTMWTTTAAPKLPQSPQLSSVPLSTNSIRRVSNNVFNFRWNDVMKRTTKTPAKPSSSMARVFPL